MSLSFASNEILGLITHDSLEEGGSQAKATVPREATNPPPMSANGTKRTSDDSAHMSTHDP